jgi:hypothetical protein
MGIANLLHHPCHFVFPRLFLFNLFAVALHVGRFGDLKYSVKGDGTTVWSYRIGIHNLYT